MIFSESNKEIASAMVKAWGELENPKHNSTVKVSTKNGGSYTFDYTDLNGIFDEARRVFKEQGISIIQNSYTELVGNTNMVCIETMFLHTSGEWCKSLPLKFPSANGMQDFGGQITYMKRYSLSAMLGIATEKDDDANGASGNSYEYKNKQQQSMPKPTNATEAGQMKISFGKHSGKTLKQIMVEDRQYINWLAENDKTDPAIKEGINMMLIAVAQSNAAKQLQAQ